MPSLLEGLRDHLTQPVRHDIEAYVSLLKIDSDTPESREEMQRLAFKLQRPMGQIIADRDAILRYGQLRSIVNAGRAVAAKISRGKKLLAEFDTEAARITAELAAKRQSLAVELGSHLSTKSQAEDGIAEAAKLKQDFADVLANELDPGPLDQ